ncbi:hypothetical protein AVEN_95833-1 [Araneus ventricosus]|uniref:Uncharacterized protein n=1 Tax=Araneus ventricosus TaxID=182803 RepID=A0A4Y2FFF8_ARAVE|nr:hypothetical protein AVEN_95833-1 [Araneus ventricosus]
MPSVSVAILMIFSLEPDESGARQVNNARSVIRRQTSSTEGNGAVEFSWLSNKASVPVRMQRKIFCRRVFVIREVTRYPMPLQCRGTPKQRNLLAVTYLHIHSHRTAKIT